MRTGGQGFLSWKTDLRSNGLQDILKLQIWACLIRTVKTAM